MDRERFWALVEATKDGDCDRHAAALAAELGTLTPSEIIAFDDLLGELKSEAWTWDLWGAAYLINGGCSHDGFLDFLSWLVGQGRAVFDMAVRTPDSLAEHLRQQGVTNAAECYAREFWCQELTAAADDAYEALTGQEFPETQPDTPYQGPLGPAGQEWDFEDHEQMRRRLPRLWGLMTSDA